MKAAARTGFREAVARVFSAVEDVVYVSRRRWSRR
jgi:hypothetical protein